MARKEPKKNYNTGYRHELVKMCMQFGCIPRQGLYLAYSGLDKSRKPSANNQNCARHILRDMVHEGVMVTAKNGNGNCTGLARSKGRYADEIYISFSDKMVDVLKDITGSQFDDFRTKVSHRAAGQRFIDVANAGMFAHGIPGISIFADNKPVYTESSDAPRTYYLPYEFKQGGSTTAGHDSRALGLLHDRDNCYILYGVKNGRKFNSEKEYVLQIHLMSLYHSKENVKRIYLYNEAKDIGMLCTGSTIWAQTESEDLFRYHEMFGPSYLIPRDKKGQALFSLLLTKDYEDRMMMSCMSSVAVMTARNRHMLCDGYEDGIQVLCHMVPDYGKLLSYLRMAKSSPEEMFRIYCYDFQEEYLTEAISPNIELLSVSVYDVFNSTFDMNITE